MGVLFSSPGRGTIRISFTIQAATARWVPWHEWLSSDHATRVKYLDWVARQAVRAKKSELMHGVDIHRRPLRPVNMAWRKDGATGPPLSPHGSESRSSKLMRSRTNPSTGEVTVYWDHDEETGKNWGLILWFHAYPARLVRHGRVVGKLPRRDVIGLTRENERRIRAAAPDYWKKIGGGKVRVPGGRALVNPETARTYMPGDREMIEHAEKEGFFSGFRKGIKFKAFGK